MPIFRTPQVILFSANLPRAIAFYSRLGFTEDFRVPTEGEPTHVDLALDSPKIGIASPRANGLVVSGSPGPPTPMATRSRSSSPFDGLRCTVAA